MRIENACICGNSATQPWWITLNHKDRVQNLNVLRDGVYDLARRRGRRVRDVRGLRWRRIDAGYRV